jgi:hypothetical protein
MNATRQLSLKAMEGFGQIQHPFVNWGKGDYNKRQE